MTICNLLPNRVILRERKGGERERETYIAMIASSFCSPQKDAREDKCSFCWHQRQKRYIRTGLAMDIIYLARLGQLASFHTGTVTNRLSYVQTLTSATVFVSPVLASPVLFTQIQRELCRMIRFPLHYSVDLSC